MPSQTVKHARDIKHTAYTIWARLPRPDGKTPDGVIVPEVPPMPPAEGMGERPQLGHLAPVGEAARRDPHTPEPYAGGSRVEDQRDASPEVPRAGKWHAGGGVNANGGYAGALVYVKHLGQLITRTLA